MQFDSYTTRGQFVDIIGRASRRNDLQKQITVNPKPAKWERPRAQPIYEQAGSNIGMDGNEIEILLQEALTSNSIVVQQALVKLLTLCKLTSADALVDYHATLQQDRKTFDRRQKENFEFWQQRAKPQNDRYRQQISELEAQARRRWLKQLDGLVLAVDRYNSHGVMCGTDLALWNEIHRAGYGFISSGLRKLKYSELSVINLDKLAKLLGEVNYNLETPF